MRKCKINCQFSIILKSVSGCQVALKARRASPSKQRKSKSAQYHEPHVCYAVKLKLISVLNIAKVLKALWKIITQLLHEMYWFPLFVKRLQFQSYIGKEPFYLFPCFIIYRTTGAKFKCMLVRPSLILDSTEFKLVWLITVYRSTERKAKNIFLWSILWFFCYKNGWFFYFYIFLP